MTINIGLIGYGRWGKIICNNLIKRDINISISTSQNKKKILSNLPQKKSVNVFKNYKLMLKDTNLDGLIIASPPSTHEEIAIAALNSKIPVLIEKPIVMKLDGVSKIFNLAIKKKLPVLVDYIHLYSPYFNRIQKLCKNTKILKIVSKAHSNGPIRNYSILWDWLPHDLSMIRSLCGNTNKLEILDKIIVKKNKFGMNVKIKAKINNTIIYISVGNLYKVKKRCLEVEYGNHNKIVYDDQKIFNKKLKQNNKFIKEKNILPLDNLINKFIFYLKKK